MAGAYQTGIYRNVLKECGYDETAIGERLEQTFETIFYGTEAQRFYHEAGGDMAYLEDTGNHDVRTEGMSYGMMVCVQMDKKAEFDRLLEVGADLYVYSGRTLPQLFCLVLQHGWNAQCRGTGTGRRRVFCHGIVFCICPLGGRRRYFCLQQRGKSNPAGMYSQRGAWTSGRTYVGAFQSSDQICHKHGFF